MPNFSSDSLFSVTSVEPVEMTIVVGPETMVSSRSTLVRGEWVVQSLSRPETTSSTSSTSRAISFSTGKKPSTIESMIPCAIQSASRQLSDIGCGYKAYLTTSELSPRAEGPSYIARSARSASD